MGSSGPGIPSQAAGAGAALADGPSANGARPATERSTTGPASTEPASTEPASTGPASTGPATTEVPSLAERVAADGVRFILATFVDLNGKPCAKLVPAEAVDMLATDGAGFAGYAAGALGQRPATPT